jgi:uncharacterized membrane protein YkvA (DUF1232 family)
VNDVRSAESEPRASEGEAPPDALEGGEGDAAEAPVRASLSLRTVKEVVRGIPRFGVLLFRLLGDGRVSLVDRALFGFALTYLFTPVDLVPDWILGFGELDDLLVVFLALDRLLHRTDREVLLEHWDGDRRPLLMVTDLLDRVMQRLPRWIRGVLRAG